ncbi:unnamed protein product, partial [Scytosiphon promiscuus]
NARRGDTGHSLLDMAAAQGHLEGLEAIIARGADVNATDAVGSTALHVASYWDQAGAVDILCSSGARVDDADDKGYTPLHVAAANGASGAIVALVHHGASQTKQSGGWRQGLPPLLVAVESGHLAAATVLLHAAEEDDEAFVDRRWGEDEYTALDLAARGGHREILRMIIRHGADVDAADSGGVTALYLAALNDQACAVHELVGAGASLGARAKGRQGMTALHVASAEGSNEAVHALLVHGAPQHQYDSCHRTPLHLAAARGERVAVRMLLAAGSNPTVSSISRKSLRYSALETAASVGNDDAVRVICASLHRRTKRKRGELGHFPKRGMESTLADALGAIAALVRHGANVDRIEEKGRTPLHTAVIHGSTGATEALLKAGADVEKRCDFSERRCSALDMTAEQGEIVIMDVLIRHQADVNAAEPVERMTPLHVAARADHAAAVNMLLDAGAAPSAPDDLGSTPLHAATATNARAAMMALTKRGAEINKKNSAGKAPLHLAAAAPDPASVRVLVSAGADVALRGGSPPDEETTALDVAAKEGHESVIRELANQPGAVHALAAAGADVEAHLVGHGWTPLHSAAEDAHLEVVRALLERGASVRARDADNDNDTPLHVAVRQAGVEGAYEIVEDLLRHGADEEALNDHGLSPVSVVGDIVGVDVALPVMELLARAPGDRAWRRRGLLILCCARTKRGKEGESHVGQGKREDGRREPGSDGVVEGWASGGTQGGAHVTVDDRCADGLERIVDWLLGLREEGLFRIVVGFL